MSIADIMSIAKVLSGTICVMFFVLLIQLATDTMTSKRNNLLLALYITLIIMLIG